jgi:hypothetical protein
MKKDTFNRIALMPFIVWLFVIVSARSNGPDLDGYRLYYDITYLEITELLKTGVLTPFNIKLILEIVFSSISYLSGHLTSFEGYIWIIAFLQTCVLTLIIKKIDRPILFFTIYLGLIFFFTQVWYLRQGFSLLFFILHTLQRRHGESSRALILLSCLSHFSAVFIYIGLWILRRVSSNALLMIIFVGIPLYLLKINLLSFLINFIPFYGEYADSSYGVSQIGIIRGASILLLLYLIAFAREVNHEKNYGFLLLYLSIVPILYFNNLPLLDRMTSLYHPLALYFILSEAQHYFPYSKIKRGIIKISCLGLIMLIFVNIWILSDSNIEWLEIVLR